MRAWFGPGGCLSFNRHMLEKRDMCVSKCTMLNIHQNNSRHSDFFVTITWNLNWPEIIRALLPTKIPQDRSDFDVGVL